MRIYVYTDDGRTVEMTEDFRITYDTAVGSMDFGSGFLDSEEVAALKRVARAIGADPLLYQHDRCRDCGHDRERHYDQFNHAPDGELTRQRGCWTADDGTWLRSGNFYSPATRASQCPCMEFTEEQV